MGVVVHKFVSAIADGGDATLVRPLNWNESHSIAADASLTIDDGELLESQRYILSGTNRVTLMDAGRIILFGYTDSQVYNVVGFPKAPSAPFRVPNGWQFNQFERIVLGGNTRGILEGTADMNLIDETSTSRLVLAGRG